MKNLVVIGHPDKKSFCYSGIYKTIKNEMEIRNEEFEVIDLYRDKFTRPRDKVIKKYQELVTWTDRIYIISPVWWFRLTPRMEIFFDEVFNNPGKPASKAARWVPPSAWGMLLVKHCTFSLYVVVH